MRVPLRDIVRLLMWGHTREVGHYFECEAKVLLIGIKVCRARVWLWLVTLAYTGRWRSNA